MTPTPRKGCRDPPYARPGPPGGCNRPCRPGCSRAVVGHGWAARRPRDPPVHARGLREFARGRVQRRGRTVPARRLHVGLVAQPVPTTRGPVRHRGGCRVLAGEHVLRRGPGRRGHGAGPVAGRRGLHPLLSADARRSRRARAQAGPRTRPVGVARQRVGVARRGIGAGGSAQPDPRRRRRRAAVSGQRRLGRHADPRPACSWPRWSGSPPRPAWTSVGAGCSSSWVCWSSPRPT